MRHIVTTSKPSLFLVLVPIFALSFLVLTPTTSESACQDCYEGRVPGGLYEARCCSFSTEPCDLYEEWGWKKKKTNVCDCFVFYREGGIFGRVGACGGNLTCGDTRCPDSHNSGNGPLSESPEPGGCNG